MRWEKNRLATIVQNSINQSEVLQQLGLANVGGNGTTLKRYCRLWNIDISHFVSYVHNTEKSFVAISLEKILVENSSYLTGASLKKRLFKAGLKKNTCEICGQDENWFGKKMSMILDHINGKHNDNRIENLRIVCPNCNSTLETHCGKKNRKPCPICGELRTTRSKFCSRKCYMKSRIGQVRQRKVERPSYEVLMKEIKEFGYSAVGRKYKVSGNAIYLWVRRYETGRTTLES